MSSDLHETDILLWSEQQADLLPRLAADTHQIKLLAPSASHRGIADRFAAPHLI